jgi:tetratricopeptide (TPR) repeat protein
MGPRLTDKLRQIAALLFITYALVAGFAPVMDNVDLGWHVAQGRWMVQHFAFYRHDVFNYPNLGHAVIDEYPLFQVVLYAFWSVGWWGPSLLTSALLVALLVVLMRAAKGADAFLQSRLLAALGMMLLLLHIGSLLRPHLVSYLCLATLGAFLIRHRHPRSWTEFWPMALLQIAWTNSHSAFVIGPAMVGLFGAEVTLRRWWGECTFPRAAALMWLAAFALVLLACFVNPYGVARFQPPLIQEHLESIRAYVGEMEPLPAGAQSSFFYFIAFFGAWFVLSRPQWRGLSLAFVVLAAFFFLEALDARKAWPIFGVMLPLIVLSERAFAAPREKQAGVGLLAANFAIATCIVAALVATWQSIPNQWREVAVGHSELSYEAIAWMKANHIQGKLFHRCEDGGLLQIEGFPQTFSDTGFGKFDEAFIHETGLVNERPALVPRYLAAYKPDYVVCSNWCYQWPYYLKQAGWRIIFYSPNSSVWTWPETRTDLPTVTDNEIKSAFEHDLAENGVPSQIALYGRNLIALNSLGLGDFAIGKLKHSISRSQFAWAWEAARIICFEPPAATETARQSLQIYADTTKNDSPALREFSAYWAQGNPAKAKTILQMYPNYPLHNAEAQLFLKIELDQSDPAALPLARRTDCWDLRNGRHWMYLAEAEERWGSLDAARAAWRKAVFYYPDDGELMKAAAEFAAKHDDAELKQAIADSAKVYGVQ